MSATVISLNTGSERSFAIASDLGTTPIPFLEKLEVALAGNFDLSEFEPQVGIFLEHSLGSDWFSILARACRILARAAWTANATKKIDPSENTDEQAKALTGLTEWADAYNQRITDQRQQAIVAGKVRFPPGYWLIDEFEAIFGSEDDPLVYINKTIEALTIDPPYQHAEDCWYSDDVRFRMTESQIDLLVRQIIVPLLNAFSMKDAKRGKLSLVAWPALVVMIERLFTQPREDAFDEDTPSARVTSDFSKVSPNSFSKKELFQLQSINTYDNFIWLITRPGIGPVPQGLFVSIMRRVSEGAPSLEVGEETSDIRRYLVSFPFGKPVDIYLGWADFEKQMLGSEWINDLKACFPTPRDVPFIPINAYSSLALISFWGTQDNEFHFENDFRSAYDLLSRKIDDLMLDLGGRFPFEPCSEPGWQSHYLESQPKWSLLLTF